MSRSEGQVLEPGLRPLNIRNQTTCSSDIPLHLSSRLCEGDLVPGLALPVERFHPVVQTLSRVHSTGRSQNICRGFYLPNATSPIKRDLFDFRDVLTKNKSSSFGHCPNCLIRSFSQWTWAEAEGDAGKVVQEPVAKVLGWPGPASQSLSSAVMFLLSQGQGAITQGLRKSWILSQPWEGVRPCVSPFDNDLNKTIGDEGITVDFWIIKVHTPN